MMNLDPALAYLNHFPGSGLVQSGILRGPKVVRMQTLQLFEFQPRWPKECKLPFVRNYRTGRSQAGKLKLGSRLSIFQLKLVSEWKLRQIRRYLPTAVSAFWDKKSNEVAS
jgi:hypothetical protein